MDFSNRQIVVTGGTGALGGAVVGALLRAGARCTVPYVHAAEAERFAQRGDPNVTLVPVTNLADEAEVARVFNDLAASTPLWASIHIAGGFAAGTLVSCFLCCRAAVNAMLKGKQGGRIVNIAARPALEWRSGAGMSAYAIAKAGVAVLTTTLAEEVAKDGILANAVAPSIMDTPANRAAMPKADFDAWPKVEDVAATILFLTSPDNKVTRGAVVPVYGKS
jgi:NAD(P)-dependent dehydrogenase (short-subunit alcohol dehydrogenase family)